MFPLTVRGECLIKIQNFTTIESEYGHFIVNRHCAYQADVLIKTGKPHIQPELDKILGIISTLPEGSVVLDAGANIGLVTIPVAQLLTKKGGVVHAFEPQKMMSYALCGALALNDLENVEVYHQALGESNGILTADRVDYSQPQDFGLFSLAVQSEQHPHTVSVTTIDSLGLPRLDFLKIDVEGMEVDALKGGRETIESHLPWCWVEYWKGDTESIKAQFKDLDYIFYMMDQLNMLCAPNKRMIDSAITINAKTM